MTTLQGEKRTRKRRTKEEKEPILAAAAVLQDIGLSHTAIAHDIDVPRTTLLTWISEGELDDLRKGTSDSAYRQIKVRMLNDFAVTAKAGLGAVNTLLSRVNNTSLTPKDAGDLARAAREAAVATGIAADKVMLLTGQATSRTERIDKSDPEGLQMFAEAMKAAGLSSTRPVKQAEIIEGEFTPVE
jgi:transposase-like protein